MMHIEKFLISFVPILNTKNRKKKSIQFCPRDFQLSTPNLHLLAYLVRKSLLQCLSHLETLQDGLLWKMDEMQLLQNMQDNFKIGTHSTIHTLTLGLSVILHFEPHPTSHLEPSLFFPPTWPSSFPILFLSFCLFPSVSSFLFVFKAAVVNTWDCYIAVNE